MPTLPTPPRPTIFLETYGCQMNVLDSELVRDQLATLGYRFVQSPEEAGVVLLNTCSVRDLSEHKVWSKLGRLGIDKREERPELVIGVLGCMAEREGHSIIKRTPQVDLLCGPSNLDELPALVENALLNRGRQVSLAGHTSRRSQTLEHAGNQLENLDLARVFSPGSGVAQAYVRVTRGCNKFCSFCVVPYTRGAEVHRSPDHILEEVKRLVGAGVLEVTLLGQTINHYLHHDGARTTSFADLLWRIHEEVPDLPRLRFLTSYPRDFGDDALDVMAAAPRICRYLHIPAQSGSNAVLQRMNRGYTVEAYEDLLLRARQRMPDIRLAGDMIAGFPGESDADHAASVAMLRRARYKSCYVFKYSPRSGTLAARRYPDDIPEGLKKARNLELLEVQAEVTRTLFDSYVGQRLDVLVEDQSRLRDDSEPAVHESQGGGVHLGWHNRTRPSGWVRLRGRTPGDEIVAFDGPVELIGRLTQVRAVRATPLTIMAEWCQPPGAAPQPSPELPVQG